MAVKQYAYGKTAHADNMELFVLKSAQIAGECPAWIANKEMTLIQTNFSPLEIKLVPTDFNKDVFRT